MKSNILIVGVGGQGIILASNVLSNAAVVQNLKVKKSETHGMAQRGGSVETHVRLSKTRIYSPLIPPGEVDVFLAFEPLEALRYLDLLSDETKLVVNSNPFWVPGYPDIEEVLAELRGRDAVLVDALKLSWEAGFNLTQNIVLLGAASPYLPLKRKCLMQAINDTVKKKVDVNLKAFELGAQV
ncbi:MAG: indolepyruvate oxidoreductase [Candidatus Altiarchaeales archaeon ex4484_96]|nr:MAG: indolepyruvate oxidoreductase [Candidatus Altiarchaeales archaeon ex4484_96]